MKFMSVRDVKIGQVSDWTTNETVVTNNGRPVAIITPTSPERFEEDLALNQNLQMMRLLAKIRTDAKANGTDKLTLKEINAEIKASRRARRRGH